MNDFFAYRDMSDETDTTSEVARVLGRTVLGLHPEPGPKRDEMIREAAAVLAEAGLLREIAQTTAEGVGPIATDRPAP